ncbi:MAG: NAD(P)-dependent dehydrogenase (short-subunit alcohol dehydrogenase family) [Flammeovirgaceae bacterium]|jgi:dehydrogenase/reductase SDR family protein 4
MNISYNLEGKVAIVTGASKGIGEAIAESLAEAGAKVVVSSRKQDQVDEVAKRLTENGGEAIGIAANVGNTEDVENLIEKTIAHFGGVDILINNAATNPVFGPVTDTDLSAFDKIMDVNLKGPFYLSQLAFKSMKARGGGSIVNISSVEGLSPGFGLGVYSVSKSALIMLTKVMAKEWGGYNIRANVICPGLIKTKFSEALWNNDKTMDMVMRKQPIKRIGQVEDLVGLTLLLSSDAGSYSTGSVFTVDGGLTI